MAGEFIAPFSAVPRSANRTYRDVYDGNATGVEMLEGLGVVGSPASNSIWELAFHLPFVAAAWPSTGALKLRLLAQANNGSAQDAKIDPQWAVVAVDADPGAASLNAEGTQTLSWGASDAHKFKEIKIPLDQVAVGSGDAGKILVMDLVFVSAAWTLSAKSVWYPWLIWEV